MNTKKEKRIYCTPQLASVKLDNEISLVLVSGDPNEPGVAFIPEYFNNNPLKNNLS